MNSTGTVYMVGLFIGSYIIGYAGDRWGRKLTMMISLLFLILGGTFAGVMPYYSLYVVWVYFNDYFQLDNFKLW